MDILWIVVILYLWFSFLVAFATIKYMINIESYYDSIPIGDLHLYKHKSPFSAINFVFFPCFLMIGFYILIVKVVNFIFFR